METDDTLAGRFVDRLATRMGIEFTTMQRHEAADGIHKLMINARLDERDRVTRALTKKSRN